MLNDSTSQRRDTGDIKTNKRLLCSSVILHFCSSRRPTQKQTETLGGMCVFCVVAWLSKLENNKTSKEYWGPLSSQGVTAVTVTNVAYCAHTRYAICKDARGCPDDAAHGAGRCPRPRPRRGKQQRPQAMAREGSSSPSVGTRSGGAGDEASAIKFNSTLIVLAGQLYFARALLSEMFCPSFVAFASSRTYIAPSLRCNPTILPRHWQLPSSAISLISQHPLQYS